MTLIGGQPTPGSGLGCVKTQRRLRHGKKSMNFRSLRPIRGTKITKDQPESGHFRLNLNSAWSFHTARVKSGISLRRLINIPS